MRGEITMLIKGKKMPSCIKLKQKINFFCFANRAQDPFQKRLLPINSSKKCLDGAIEAHLFKLNR